jgi:hypothetical protein
MCHYCIPLGLLLFLAIASGRADDTPAKPLPPLGEDLVKLRGSWKLAAPPKGGHLYLEFGKDGRLDVIHAVVGRDGRVTARYAFIAFELKDHGQKRAITPTKKGGRAGDLAYRFEGEALVIEGGECAIRDVQAQKDYTVLLKGEWRRVGGDLEKLRATWRPAKPARGTEVRLEFRNDLLEVSCRFPNELGMGPVEQDVALVELKGDGPKRVISPVRGGAGLSRITYRWDGDTLVIEDGEYTIDGRKVPLRGEWKGDRGERVP